ncbi:MAG: hypothetical protein IJI96_05430 [Methanobrevibacter sp.]|nr:hypothetical protein [Methanobrevibacter sp.]MBQ6629766.1 hypothetical protein [Methanobrevibacter sp.]
MGVSETFYFHMTLTFNYTWNDNGMWFVFRHGVNCIILTITTLENHCKTAENQTYFDKHGLLH